MRNVNEKTRVYRLKSTKRRNIGVIAVTSIALVGAMIWYFNKNYIYNNKIAKNILIEDVNVSNMQKESAIKTLNKKYSPKVIKLYYNNEEFNIKPQDIDLEYNIEDSVNEAYNYTKTDKYLENLKRYFSLINNKKEFKIISSYDESKLSKKISEISQNININMVNAKVYISSSGDIITSDSIMGKELDIAYTKEKILSDIKNKDYKDIQLKVNTIKPHITTEQAKSINTVLGEFSTTFSTSAKGRVHNIRLSGHKSSNVILMPEEEYSYNNQTGIRNKSNGYDNAPVIINGKLEDALGGGVCQVSTTLYNAVLESGLKLTTISNHSLKSTYVPIGRDAMVNDSGTDFRFKNPYKNPIYVKTVVDDGIVTCRIYGNNEDKKNISIYVDAFKQNGLDASKTYRIYKDSNGNVIQKEYIHKSVYQKPKN